MKKLRALLALVAALGGVWKVLKPEQKEQIRAKAKTLRSGGKEAVTRVTAETKQAVEDVGEAVDAAGNPIQPQPKPQP
jgi:hypothetical protein